ncbi:hypothetical protein [Bacillus sp. JJ722]|uniref:hypothetical protein n=1 Tax=Bacillus sp. JJ722 TaxID=3122973 RepID=UPI002FFEA13E
MKQLAEFTDLEELSSSFFQSATIIKAGKLIRDMLNISELEYDSAIVYCKLSGGRGYESC